MAYIGRDISNLSDRAVLDNITASATATYNLLLNSVAYVPSSAESLTVSLNGVIQKPQSSYTVSGSTIVFASALTSSDSIDFIIAERAITLTTVGSGSVGTSQLADDAVTYAKTDGSFGKIGQVVQVVKTDTGTINSQTFATISGLSLNITPTATSSKILLMMNINASGDRSAFRFLRDSTAIGIGATDGSRIQATNASPSSSDMFEVGMTFLDSPNTTSETTFIVQARNLASGANMRINRKETDTDNNEHPRTICTLTAMEVLA